MSNFQHLKSNYSSKNNTPFVYRNIQNDSNPNLIKFPFDYESRKKLDLRNYNNISPTRSSTKIIKENEVHNLNAYQLADYHSKKLKQKNTIKEKVNIYQQEAIEEIIKQRNDKAFLNEEREKLDLERDITNIISHALNFSKKNTPLTAMMNNQLSEKFIRMKSLKRKKSKNSKNSASLNNSLGSMMNLSFLSNKSVSKYESNRFLKALGLDLANLNPGNINIDIDQAMGEISKWRCIDKSKIRNLIRMRVINEISSVEERKSVQKLKAFNNKFKEIMDKRNKSNNNNNNINVNINTNVNKSIDKEINNISNIENNISKLERSVKFENDNNTNTNLVNTNINNTNNNVIITNNVNTNSNTNIKKNNNNNNNNNNNTNITNNNTNMNTDTNYQTNTKLINTNLSLINNTMNITNNVNNKLLPNNVTYNQSTFNNTNIKDKSNSKSKYGRKKYVSPFKKEKKIKKKGKVNLNSYGQAENIMKIVNSNPNIKANKNVFNHFNSILKQKQIDGLVSKVVSKNRISYNKMNEE